MNKNNVRIYRNNYACLPKRFADKINADIEYVLAAEIPGLKEVYLFGSCARGDLKSSSDVDLLIITREKMNDRMLASDIRWKLDEQINGVSTDVVFMNEASVREDTVFHRVVNRDKILILEVKESL